MEWQALEISRWDEGLMIDIMKGVKGGKLDWHFGARICGRYQGWLVKRGYRPHSRGWVYGFPGSPGVFLLAILHELCMVFEQMMISSPSKEFQLDHGNV